ncbi:MAG: pyridoxamine 5'-phosphate oxidase family protein [Emcibacteraceae bacterium]|nr:pyridoxamine 5'-phosphate oxidase family protein [Emcibacteraceae bacterium]
MGHKFAEIAFTETVREIQSEMGSRNGYEGMEGGEDYNHLFSEVEAQFIMQRDSFYMATTSETGWPYVQHRGGPAGFVKIIDANTIGFSDYAGNRQYVSIGNLRTDDRISLFFMDYPNRRRLKIMGRVRLVNADDLETLANLEDNHFRAPIERAFLIDIEAFDWNCPKYITPRYTDAEVEGLIAPLQLEIEQLRNEGKNSPKVIIETPNEIGNGALKLTITAIRQEADNIRSYELRSVSNEKLPAVEAGAHIQVPVLLENGETIWRFYSMCSDPNQTDYYQIAVLDQPDGRGGSHMLHKQYQLGMVLGCYRPENYFALQEEKHKNGTKAVFIAGGIGITPIRSMVKSAAFKNYDYEVHYAARSSGSAAFIEDLGEKTNFYLASEKERLELEELFKKAEPSTIHYLCGPPEMIEAARAISKKQGLPSSSLIFEAFDE